MTPNAFSSNASPAERRLLILLGLISLALVGGALYFQFVKNEDPCPLCILQRYAYLLIALFSFLGAGFSNRGGGRTFFKFLAMLAALGGVIAAARHVWVLNSEQSCGFDKLQPIVDSLPPAHWLPSVFKVAGLCETPYPPILGLSLPAWALVGFAIAWVALILNLLRSRARYR